MQTLPVPPLTQTLDRYLAAVSPLLSAEEMRGAEDAVASTLQGEGPACQSALEAFADAEAPHGRSWLSAAWLRGYLAVRTPLPLTSNVGFQIRVPVELSARHSDDRGRRHARAAAVIHRLAAVHLASLRGELPPERTARGEDVCGVQREVLAGGVRHPAPEVDEVRVATPDPANREIGLLVDDRFCVVPISDDDGMPLPAEVLQRAVESAVDAPASTTPGSGPGFTALSYLGSETAAAYLERLLEEPTNRRVYDRLTQALFVVNLITDPADDQEHLRHVAFLPGHAWAYTSITYQVGLADDFVGMHLEHSRIDAATLKTVLALAQQDPETHDAKETEAAQISGSAEHLEWALTKDLAADLDRGIAAYRAQAEQLRLDTVRVDRPAPADPAVPVSDDALCQWVMLYAQLATYGQVRSTYEAVDLRHFEAGRTECLRSNTPEAVALVRALIAGQATTELLQEAATAHKEWVKACKTGQGIDRHLTGLALMATRAGHTLPVHEDAGWRRLTTDFLSTTSIGDQDQISGMAFAPTSGGGIGINYTPLERHYELLVISHRTQRPDIETFLTALDRGAQALAALLNGDATPAEKTP